MRTGTHSPLRLLAVLAFAAGFFATPSADAQLVVTDSGVGYIDNAIPGTQFRLRFDSAVNNDLPDRAEFFYAKCGCFRLAGLSRNAPGPPKIETSVDYQDLSSYLEYAFHEDFSIFAELPVRFLDPSQNDNTAGLGDMNAGVKLLMYGDEDLALTFQFRVYAPTGDASRGLGTHHASLEPGILIFHRLSDRVFLEGEVRDWIPVSGTDFAGNIIRYGIGLGVIVHESSWVRIRPIVEAVGWSVLDGKAFDGRKLVLRDADGDTIVNLKIGIRLDIGSSSQPAYGRHSLYAGWGHALTGDVWYEDIARVEYRLTF